MVRERAAAEDDETPAPTMATDPVCGMRVERALAAGTEEVEGRVYFFCSASCKQTFRANPWHYVQHRPDADAGAGEPNE